MKKNLLSTLFFMATPLFMTMALAQESKIDTTKTKVIRIDPSTANGGEMSRVFSEINFIPLETTKQSLFGDIAQLEVTEDRFIIYDSDTRCVLIFDKSGKYKAKIIGPTIVSTDKASANDNIIDGFKLVKKNTDNIIQIAFKHKVVNYDINGKLIEEVKPEIEDYHYNEIYNFNDSVKVVSYFKSRKGKDQLRYLYALIKKGQLPSKYLRLDTGKFSNRGDFGVGGPSFVNTDDAGIIHANRSYDYNVYRITKDGISAAYKIIFPEVNSIPADFNTNPLYLGQKMNYFLKNSQKIYGIGCNFQVGDMLYMRCGSLNASIRQNGSFVYDLKNNYLISLNRLDVNEFSNNLPVIGKRWDNDFKKFDGKYLYGCLSSLEMFSYYEQEKSKKHKYSAVMEEYFRKGSKKDNPVLIQLTPNKAL